MNRVERAIGSMFEYYRDRVPYHDSYMGYSGIEAMEDMLGPVIDLFADKVDGRDVLEIACGTGNWSQVLSRRAGTVTATDLHTGYLEIARTKELGPATVEFLVADAYSLNGIEPTFEVAFTADWVSHVPRERASRMFHTVHSKLRPGGTVIVIDMMRSRELQRMYSHTDDNGNEVHVRTLPNGRTYEVIKNYPTVHELKMYLGLEAIDFQYTEALPLKRWVLTYRLPEGKDY